MEALENTTLLERSNSDHNTEDEDLDLISSTGEELDDYDYEDEDEDEDDDYVLKRDGASFTKRNISSSSSSPETSPDMNDNKKSGSSGLSDYDDDHHHQGSLPLFNLFQKFLNREAIKKLQHRHALLNNRLEKLKKVVDSKIIREKGQSLRKEKDRIKELIKIKKNQLNDHMNAPPFIRLMDKCAFTIGLIVLCASEFVLLRSPEKMYLWYTVLIIPLMVFRFFMYHKAKYHYFMLDFCYLCNFLLLFYLFGHTYILGSSVTPSLFKLVFALTNGPLAWGTVVWRNSLVFHDVDKLTSVVLHLCPPIVSYCLRWYPDVYPLETACGGESCTLGFKETIVIPMLLYVFWQVFYYIKTEIVDLKKLDSDKEIMTSSRWMSVKQPHPLYKLCLRHGIKLNPVVILIIIQMAYTVFTLVALPLLISSFWLHTFFLVFIFVCVTWNGASYYFDYFSESYSKRLHSDIQKDEPNNNSLKIGSFYSFLKFFTIFFSSLFVYLKVIFAI